MTGHLVRIASICIPTNNERNLYFITSVSCYAKILPIPSMHNCLRKYILIAKADKIKGVTQSHQS